MTILGTCGVSDAEVRLLLLQGLQITANTTPFSDYLISRSNDFVVQNMDAYTPLLTDDELRLYIDHPQRFCADLLSNLDQAHLGRSRRDHSGCVECPRLRSCTPSHRCDV